MPLREGAEPGSKEFSENVETEVEAGKPQKQAVAIAYREARSDDAGPATHRAAGILFRAKDGEALFLLRGPGGDYPGHWCFPGGHVDPEDGSAEAAACREAVEEVGSLPKGKREVLARSVTVQELPAPAGAADGAIGAVALPPQVAPKVVDYTTFVQDVDDRFDVVKDGEHVGHAWAPLSLPPEPLHPGARVAIDRLFADELGTARMIADGRLTSPQRYKNVTLWAMRITGTGVAYRRPVLGDKGEVLCEEEFPWRDPSLYLNDEFLARCNGLPVIGGHPKGKTLDSKEFGRRIVGTVFLPFIRGEEVWGIAKVWDDETNEELAAGTADGKDYSTSPAVVLSDPASPSYKFRLEDGSVLLVEGKPSLLDHLAICERGVWDKGGEPAGIINHKETEEMKEDIKADAVKEPTMAELMAAIGGVAKAVTDVGARVDSMEENFKKDSEKAEDKKDDADKDGEKKDDSDKEKADESDKDKKDDSDKEKADGDKPEEVAADASKRADAACAKADAATGEVAGLKKVIAEMSKRLPAERSDDDHRTMASCQARADGVFELFGRQAPRFLSGETSREYRTRLVNEFKEHSASWKPVDLATLADAAFAVAEEQVYADAAFAAKNAVGVEDGGLRMVPGRTPSGHSKVEFFGRPGAWLGRFSGTRRYATRISPNTSKSEVA